MTSRLPLSPEREGDYLAIESAVMETARGRWFLAEYTRRHRAADTDAVLEAIGRLEQTVAHQNSVSQIDRIKIDLADMAQAIERTKTEIAALRREGEHEPISRATIELDAIVNETEAATSTILGAAEKIQEVAWTMREDGADGEICDVLDTQSTEIYTACSFQDLTGQRIRKVITVLGFLEHRINAMMDVWSGTAAAAAPLSARDPLLNGPALAGEGLEQSAVDTLIDEADVGWANEPPPRLQEAAVMPLDGEAIDMVPARSHEPAETPPPLTERLRVIHDRMRTGETEDPTTGMSHIDRLTLFT